MTFATARESLMTGNSSVLVRARWTTTSTIPIEIISMLIFEGSAEFNRVWYLDLYSRLSTLHDVLRKSTIPDSFDNPGCFEVNEVMLLVEDMVKQLPVENNQ